MLKRKRQKAIATFAAEVAFSNDCPIIRELASKQKEAPLSLNS